MWHGVELVLALALSLPPATAPMPPFSWSTIQTFHHCANSSGPLSSAALASFRNDSFVVIEKSQNIAGAPVNHSAGTSNAFCAQPPS